MDKSTVESFRLSVVSHYHYQVVSVFCGQLRLIFLKGLRQSKDHYRKSVKNEYFGGNLLVL